MPRYSPNPLTRVGISPAADRPNQSVPDYMSVGERFASSARPLNGSLTDALQGLIGVGAQIGKEVEDTRKINDENKALTEGRGVIKNAKSAKDITASLNAVLPNRSLSPEYRIAYRELLGAELAQRYDASLSDAMETELEKSRVQNPETGLFYQPRPAEAIQSEVWEGITADLQPEVAKSVFFRGALNAAASGANLMRSSKYDNERGKLLIAQSGTMRVGQMSEAILRGNAAQREADSRPTESRPTDSRPADSRPTDSRPADSRPTDSRPADSRPTDSRPAEALAAAPVDRYGATKAMLLSMATEAYEAGEPAAELVMKAIRSATMSKKTNNPALALEMLHNLTSVKIGTVALSDDPRFAEDIAELSSEFARARDADSGVSTASRNTEIFKMASSSIYGLTAGKRPLTAEEENRLVDAAQANTDLVDNAERAAYVAQIRNQQDALLRLDDNDIKRDMRAFSVEHDRLIGDIIRNGYSPERMKALREYEATVSGANPSVGLELMERSRKVIGADEETITGNSVASAYEKRIDRTLRILDNFEDEVGVVNAITSHMEKLTLAHAFAIRSKDPAKIKEAEGDMDSHVASVEARLRGVTATSNEDLAKWRDPDRALTAQDEDAMFHALRRGRIDTHTYEGIRRSRLRAAQTTMKTVLAPVNAIVRRLDKYANNVGLQGAQKAAFMDSALDLLDRTNDAVLNAEDPVEAKRVAAGLLAEVTEKSREFGKALSNTADAGEAGEIEEPSKIYSSFTVGSYADATLTPAINIVHSWGGLSTHAAAARAATKSSELPNELFADSTGSSKEKDLRFNSMHGKVADAFRDRLGRIIDKKGDLAPLDIRGGILHYSEVANRGISKVMMPTPEKPKPDVDLRLTTATLQSLKPSQVGFFYSPAEFLEVEKGVMAGDAKSINIMDGLLKSLVHRGYDIDRDGANKFRIVGAFFKAQREFYGLPELSGLQKAPEVASAAPAAPAAPETPTESRPTESRQTAESQPAAAESRPAPRVVPEEAERPLTPIRRADLDAKKAELLQQAAANGVNAGMLLFETLPLSGRRVYLPAAGADDKARTLAIELTSLLDLYQYATE